MDRIDLHSSGELRATTYEKTQTVPQGKLNRVLTDKPHQMTMRSKPEFAKDRSHFTEGKAIGHGGSYEPVETEYPWHLP